MINFYCPLDSLQFFSSAYATVLIISSATILLISSPLHLPYSPRHSLGIKLFNKNAFSDFSCHIPCFKYLCINLHNKTSCRTSQHNFFDRMSNSLFLLHCHLQHVWYVRRITSFNKTNNEFSHISIHLSILINIR